MKIYIYIIRRKYTYTYDLMCAFMGGLGLIIPFILFQASIETTLDLIHWKLFAFFHYYFKILLQIMKLFSRHFL